MMGGFDGMMGGWGGYGLAGGLIYVLLLVGILALAAWVLVRVFLPNRRASGGPSAVRSGSAEDILRTRFARGEIGVEEYERSLRTLRGEPPRTYEDYVREATQQLTERPPARK